MQWTVSAFADEAGSAGDDQIKALQDAGLKHIDIRNIDGLNITALPEDHAAEVKKKLDAAGITVNMYGTPLGKIDIADDFEGEIQKLKHIGKLAPILGCKAVRIFSYFNKSGLSHGDWQRQSLDRLRHLRDIAGAFDLVLYHENERHIFGDKMEDVHQIAQELRDADGPFRLIFDFDNYNQGGENVWSNWLTLRDFTDAIHLKDSKDKQHVPAGQGQGYVREILTDCVGRGWNGPISIEPHLNHSGAVASTGPSGVANQEFSKMAPHESFAVACDVAVKLIQDVGATVV